MKKKILINEGTGTTHIQKENGTAQCGRENLAITDKEVDTENIKAGAGRKLNAENVGYIISKIKCRLCIRKVFFGIF